MHQHGASLADCYDCLCVCRGAGVKTGQSQGKIAGLFRNFFGAFFGTKAALKMG
jgi:hypothetical protein